MCIYVYGEGEICARVNASLCRVQMRALDLLELKLQEVGPSVKEYARLTPGPSLQPTLLPFLIRNQKGGK